MDLQNYLEDSIKLKDLKSIHGDYAPVTLPMPKGSRVGGWEQRGATHDPS